MSHLRHNFPNYGEFQQVTLQDTLNHGKINTEQVLKTFGCYLLL